MKKTTNYVLGEVRGNSFGEIFFESIRMSKNKTDLTTMMLERAVIDSSGNFRRNGFNERNSTYRVASQFQNRGFVEFFVLPQEEWEYMRKLGMAENERGSIPKDFAVACHRLTFEELKVYYSAVPDVVIRNWIKESNIAPVGYKYDRMGRPRKDIPCDFAKVISKSSKSAAAQYYHVSKGTVYRWCKEKGIDTRENHSRNKLTIPRDFSKYAKHMKLQELADKYRVSTTTVWNWKKQVIA